jgi:hypothetical protein
MPTQATPHAIPQAPFSFGAPIPSLLWESVEEAMRANMRILAKDIAATLGQPDAPLLEALRSATVKPYLFEEADQDKELDMRCDFLCQRPDAPAVIQQCRQPVFWNATHCSTGTHRCTEHLYATPMPRPAGLMRLRPLEMDGIDAEEDSDTSLFHTQDGSVLNGAGAARGRYEPRAKRLTLFVVEEGKGEGEAEVEAEAEPN